jgi:hypothetical protein
VIAFLPIDGFFSTGFWRSRVAADLIERVERAQPNAS